MKRLLTNVIAGLLLGGGLAPSAHAQQPGMGYGGPPQDIPYVPMGGFSEEAVLGEFIEEDPGTYWDPSAPSYCDPTWKSWCKGYWVDAEAIWLQRSQPQNVILASRLNAGGIAEAELNTGTAEFDYQNGFRVMAGWQIFRQIALEGGYFGLLDNQTVNGGLTETAGTTLTSRFLGGDLSTANYRLFSRLNSAELNFRFSTDPANKCYAAVLSGFRFISLEDVLTLTDGANGVTLQTSEVDVHNYLYGYQIGGEVGGGIGNELKEVGGLIGAKFGFLANSAESDIDQSFNGLNTQNSELGFTSTIELNAAVKYRFRYFALRAGYQFLCINGVALAPAQAQTTGDTLNLKSSVIYHGPFVGGEVAWPPTLR